MADINLNLCVLEFYNFISLFDKRLGRTKNVLDLLKYHKSHFRCHYNDKQSFATISYTLFHLFHSSL